MTIYSGGVTKYGYRIISCCFLVRVSIYIEKKHAGALNRSPRQSCLSHYFITLCVRHSCVFSLKHGHGQVTVGVCDKAALSSDSLLLFYIVSSPFVSNFVNLTPQRSE